MGRCYDITETNTKLESQLASECNYSGRKYSFLETLKL